MALFKGWASTQSGLSVDANNPDRVMVTTINGSLLTVDGGHSWNVIHSAPMRATGNEGGGIAIMSAWHYAFDPHRADRQIISMNDFRRRAERRRRTHVEPLHRRQPLAAEHLQRALRPARRRPRVGGVFADARRDAGIPVEGYSRITTQSLRSYRSAPPLVAPLSTGLTMRS